MRSHRRLFVQWHNRLGTLIFFGIIILYLIIHHKTQMTNIWIRTQDSQLATAIKPQESRPSFIEDWCRVENLRRDWKRLLSPCRGNVSWKESTPWNSPWSTDPDTSYISLWDIRPVGELSRVVLQTQTKDGQSKRIGGDAWRVHLRGPSSFSPTVIDHDNGTYEIIFLAMEHGKYQMEVMLDYTMCDGLRNPPEDWFVKGDAQGKYQVQGILGNDSPYLLKPLWGGPGPIEVNIPAGTSDEAVLLTNAISTCKSSCKRLWHGLGRWVNGTWTPYLPEEPYTRWPRRRKGLFWIYGDSMAMALFNSIRKRKLCKEIFKRCGYSYNWVYQMNNYNLTLNSFVKKPLALAKRENDNLDFSITRILNEISQVLFHPEMDENGVVLLNLGLHYVENTNFTNYQALVNGVINLVKDVTTTRIDGKEEKRKFKGRLIWKTTTAINREKYTANHLHSRRFLTYKRVEVYNAFAMDAMCAAGVDVLDVYPLTDSFPEGTGRPDSRPDPVHYKASVFDAMESLLEQYFS